MPSPHLQFGGAVDLWGNGLNGTRPAIANVGAVMAYHPRALDGGPFLEGHVVYSIYWLASADSNYDVNGGWGLTMGAGWEDVLGSPVTARVAYTYANLGRLDNNGTTVATNWRQSLLVVELGWRRGRLKS